MNGRTTPILHLEDWKNPDGTPTAVVHTTTKNKSFVRMHSLLKTMGIKNNLFHLSLLDYDLLHVDPLKLDSGNDPDGKLRAKVAVECLRNPWYFFREICKIPTPGGSPILFDLHRGNLALMWCFFSDIDIILTLPRQCGKSICAIAICCYVMFIAGYQMELSMLTLSSNLRQQNVKRLKDIRDNLPKYLLHSSPKDGDNQEKLYYAGLKNGYRSYNGQKSANDASNVGRGSSSPFLHIDEGPFIPHINITYPVIMASTNAARESAKRAGKYHANLLTTTAGDPSTTEGRWFKRTLVDTSMDFTERLYDTKDKAEAHTLIRNNSRSSSEENESHKNNKPSALRVNAVFSYLQLGKDHAWLEDQIARGGCSKSQIDRDYLNKWISHADNPILAQDITDKMYDYRRDDPDYVEVWGEYVVKWYVPASEVKEGRWKNKPIIMGCDISELIGNDFTTTVGVDPETLRVIFTFGCNTSNIAQFSTFISDFLLEYKKCLWVPERKSQASAIIDTTILQLRRAGHNPFRRIFNKIVDNKHLEEYAKVDIDNPYLSDQAYARKVLGFVTTGQSRPFLYKQVLQRAAEAAADKIYDPTLIGELVSLQARNGRIDHASAGHDDHCMAWLLAMYVIFEGKNLSTYGIDPLSILREVKSEKKNNKHYFAQQQQLRNYIVNRLELIKRTTNKLSQRLMIYDLERDVEKLDDSVSINPINPDSLKEEMFDKAMILSQLRDLKQGKDLLEKDKNNGLH